VLVLKRVLVLGLLTNFFFFIEPIAALNTWRSQNKKYGSIAIVGSGNQRIDPKMVETRALEKKMKELETANDILKKALAFFAGSQKK